MGACTVGEDREAWRVAMVIPLRGPAGLFGPSCEAIAELAADELNADGGVGGREVQLEVVDGGAPPHLVAAQLDELIGTGRVHAVTGWHISSVRNALAPIVADRVPYAYPALYEGGESRPGIYCCGETPRLQIAPALAWLRDHLGASRWFVVGDDYVWPRRSSAAVVRFARDLDLRIAGTEFIKLGGDVRRLVDRVEAAECDGVLMLLVGQDAVEFNRCFALRGLHERLMRFSPLMEENMLMASGRSATTNLFVSAAYFRSMVNPNALDLIGRYLHRHGSDAPPLNNAAESCYEGMHTLAMLIRRAGTTRLTDLNAALEGSGYHGPRGTIEFHGQLAVQSVHLAVADGYDFDVITAL